MIDRFAEALSIFWDHFWLISAIVLTVWFPGNILANYVYYYYPNDDYNVIFYMTIWFEAIFGPIYIGALVYALNQIKSGHETNYKEAILTGLKKWVRLFGARLVAGIFIGLGLIAFIIPGIILAIRYCLLDPAVVIEGKDISKSRARSIELTAGKRWEIFNSALLFFVSFVLFTLIISLPPLFLVSLDNIVVDILLDCVLDVAYTVIQIVIFLFYWEAVNITRPMIIMDENSQSQESTL